VNSKKDKSKTTEKSQRPAIPTGDTPFYNLVKLMEILRGPQGCVWDREQDIQSLKKYFLEEAQEAFESAEKEDWDGMMEEAGDVIFGMLFLAQIGKEHGKFTIDDSLKYCMEKMIRRHPHVFADFEAKTPDDVIKNWHRIKSSEKKQNKQD